LEKAQPAFSTGHVWHITHHCHHNNHYGLLILGPSKARDPRDVSLLFLGEGCDEDLGGMGFFQPPARLI
jgi:hypothetical protein